ncbi:MAG: hypothetical protein MI867_25155, partial [Pseudomonadales bacterium]|nr:hypothetical protein [Pseudomonadales bacterium]
MAARLPDKAAKFQRVWGFPMPTSVAARQRRIAFAILIFWLGAFLHGAEVTLNITDSPGEGFNSTVPVAPAGGNTGTTLGEQRRIAVQYAADIWGSLLHNDVGITVDISWDDLPCSGSEGQTAQGYPIDIHRNFTGAPIGSVWYPAALANTFTENDIQPDRAELKLIINAAVGQGGGCFGGAGWYLGLDANPGPDIDLVTVALEYLAHGLGFATRVDLPTGGLAPLAGTMDIYSYYLQDASLDLDWRDMNNTQRAASAVDTGDLTLRLDAGSNSLLGDLA